MRGRCGSRERRRVSLTGGLAIAEGVHVGWIEHWGLSGDPFVECGGPYVPLPGHEEAVARLVDAIEAGHRLAVLAHRPEWERPLCSTVHWPRHENLAVVSR